MRHPAPSQQKIIVMIRDGEDAVCAWLMCMLLHLTNSPCVRRTGSDNVILTDNVCREDKCAELSKIASFAQRFVKQEALPKLDSNLLCAVLSKAILGRRSPS